MAIWLPALVAALSGAALVGLLELRARADGSTLRRELRSAAERTRPVQSL
jgi:hypothetical protein